MKIVKENLSKELYEHNPNYKKEICDYEILYLVSEVSKMELKDPINKSDKPIEGYPLVPKKNPLFAKIDSFFENDNDKDKYVSELMEKYTSLRTTEDGEILRPSDLLHKDVNGVKEYRDAEERRELMNDFKNTAEEISPNSTKYMYVDEHYSQLTVSEKLEQAREKLENISEGVVSKNGVLDYQKINSLETPKNDLKTKNNYGQKI